MADRTYRSDRDRYDRERNFSRQAEQFEPASYGGRDEERGYGQMGEGWREEGYGQSDAAGQSYGRERDMARGPGREADYRGARFGTARYEPAESRGFNARGSRREQGPASYGAGSWLAANHGEWRDDYAASPSRENRDYRDTWGGLGSTNRRPGRGEPGFLERAGDTIAHWLGDDADYGRGERGYRGRGPANYARSDERIRDDANDRLTEDWHVDASRIEVSVESGEVTLSGTVSSREQKRRAEDCVEELSGVRHVQNNLRVEDSDWNRTTGSQSNPTSSQA